VDISATDINNLKLIRDNVSEFIRNISLKYDKPDTLFLDIAPQDHNGAAEFFKLTKIQTLDINPNSKATYIADICKRNEIIIPKNLFDFILCTEVLEHTLRPFDATAELFRILKPGGFIFISVPFNFRIHGPLPDCWRFTEHGLRSLFSQFKIIELKALETENRNLMPVHYTMIVQK
jgi:SAM-dependent methyltransferase